MTQVGMASTTAGAESGRGWMAGDETFGARLALIRQRMDWNLEEAGRECGIPPATWTNWERKGASPQAPFAAVRQISDRTGCDYLWLLAGPEARSA